MEVLGKDMERWPLGDLNLVVPPPNRSGHLPQEALAPPRSRSSGKGTNPALGGKLTPPSGTLPTTPRIWTLAEQTAVGAKAAGLNRFGGISNWRVGRAGCPTALGS